MKIKVGSVIIGFILICIGIATLAGQVAFLGIHPVVWFILGALLICSDSAWEKLARAKRSEQSGESDTTSENSNAEKDTGESSEPKEESAEAAGSTKKDTETSSPSAK
jgi:hypothetical protein